MTGISYRTSRKCNSFFCALAAGRVAGPLRWARAPGNARGNFQHPPGLPVCAIPCMLQGVMNKQLENEKAQVQPTAFLGAQTV
jgi:hypothetical protein